VKLGLLAIGVATLALGCGDVAAVDGSSSRGRLLSNPLGSCDDLEAVGVECVKGNQGPDKTKAAVDAMWENQSPYWEETGLRADSAYPDDRGLVVWVGEKRLGADQMAGLTFENVYGFRMRIDSAFQDGDLQKFFVSFEEGGWHPLCRDGRYAVAMPRCRGYECDFDPPGEIVWGFACAGSAEARALEWGYGPIESLPHSIAAVRLAMADYCSDNTSHTIDGTEVLAYDLDGHGGGLQLDSEDHDVGVPSSPADDNGDGLPFLFEAAWVGDRSAALCLSKYRWQSLPLGHLCQGSLPDPRLLRFPFAAFCEDLVPRPNDGGLGLLRGLRAKGAVVFSSSKFNEIGLWVWRNVQGRYLTTTSGLLSGANAPTPTAYPSDGYGVPQFAATILRHNKNLAAVPLYLFRGDNGLFRATRDRVIADSECRFTRCRQRWTRVQTLGFIFPDQGSVPSRFKAVALISWVRPTMDPTMSEYVLMPEGMDMPGFNRLRVEGYGLVANPSLFH
jgi:hypothetical protein